MSTNGVDRPSNPAQLDDLRSYLAENPNVAGVRLGAGYQASVELFEAPFGDFVVKRARGPFFWRRLGEAALRRERDIYERLRNLPGVPRCLGMLDGKHLVLEYIPGESYRQRQHVIENKDFFFVSLLETLKAMHDAGVAHGDLKRKDNLLVGPNDQPYVIDFGLACVRQESGRRLDRYFFEWVKQYDYNAWIKHKYDRRVDAISPEDMGYYRPMKLERIARGIRLVWQKLTLRRLRRRHR